MSINKIEALEKLRASLADVLAGLNDSMSPAQEDFMLTTSEACALMKISRWTLMRLRKKGLIQFVKLAPGKSGSIRYFWSSVLSFLNKNKMGGAGSCTQNT